MGYLWEATSVTVSSDLFSIVHHQANKRMIYIFMVKSENLLDHLFGNQTTRLLRAVLVASVRPLH